MVDAIDNCVPPIKIDNPLCQENVIVSDIDLLKDLPILTLTSEDSGPYITLGLVYAIDPLTGKKNCSIHRLCVHGSDAMTIWIVPGRHLGAFYQNALNSGWGGLPISINIGLDPAIYFSSCFTDPLIKLGENELGIAGGIRRRPVRISDCVTVPTECISDAEIVIEGGITRETADENPRDLFGVSMPEFLGYYGESKSSLPLVKVKAITYRNNPTYQSLLGPGKEQSELLAIPAEATVYKLLSEHLRIDVHNAHYSSAGGGQFSYSPDLQAFRA